MKKCLFVCLLLATFAISIPLTQVHADENYFDQWQTIAIMPHLTNDSPPLVGIMLSGNSTVICRNGWCDNSFNGNNIYQSYYYNSVSDALTAIATGNVRTVVQQDCHDPFIIIRGNISVQSGTPTIYQNINEYWDEHPDERPEPPEPDKPEAGDSWLSDMWEWVLYFLGFGDDPSIIQITGGDKVETEIITPSPTPSPTPAPSPTPYTLNIIDPSTGQPVYTVTGIPSATYNIYGGDTTNNGSDFDIFDVDLKIGNGGTSKPKDDLNDVMRTNNDYIQEMDVSAVKDSFSVLPADWFLMLGVLASMPIIAGIISKMLK